MQYVSSFCYIFWKTSPFLLIAHYGKMEIQLTLLSTKFTLCDLTLPSTNNGLPDCLHNLFHWWAFELSCIRKAGSANYAQSSASVLRKSWVVKCVWQLSAHCRQYEIIQRVLQHAFLWFMQVIIKREETVCSSCAFKA